MAIYGTLRLATVSPFSERINENLGTIIADDLVDNSKKVQFATQLDTFGRGVASILKSTYDDVKISIEFSTNEILVE